MNTNTSESFSEKILRGVKKAIDKMIEYRAKMGDDVLIFDENGKPIRVKATELRNKI